MPRAFCNISVFGGQIPPVQAAAGSGVKPLAFIEPDGFFVPIQRFQGGGLALSQKTIYGKS